MARKHLEVINMKDYIVLEVNGKKECLGNVTIDTPNEYLLANNIESILNNRIFEEFIDKIFWLTVNDFSHEFDKKIDNVFITFLDNNEEFICSIVIDKFKPRKGIYRMKVIDWKLNGYTFKYVGND